MKCIFCSLETLDLKFSLTLTKHSLATTGLDCAMPEGTHWPSLVSVNFEQKSYYLTEMFLIE